MYLPKYQLTSDPDFLSYEFISEGPKGLILKRIQFTLISSQGVYNLGFGDKNIITGKLDDKVVTNNGDGEKVLTTVVNAVFTFLNHYPNAWVFATGSTPARTRLYQMGINQHFDEIIKRLEVYGQVGEEWHEFEPNQNYRAFLATIKTI